MFTPEKLIFPFLPKNTGFIGDEELGSLYKLLLM
jgi:hypothetical protein